MTYLINTEETQVVCELPEVTGWGSLLRQRPHWEEIKLSRIVTIETKEEKKLMRRNQETSARKPPDYLILPKNNRKRNYVKLETLS